MPSVVMDLAKGMYASYQTLQALDKTKYSDVVRSMRDVAMPAILYEYLEDANWFRERLREAADQFDPDQPAGDVSTPQKDNPVQTDEAKKITRFEIDHYDQSQDTAYSADDSENPGEADDPKDDNLPENMGRFEEKESAWE
ncbi:hypothetical protein M378DRAFT_181931 [Amanita muscaria Koide BX008]|uniref:Uncharacterized protein n=1 Tax=Amanita muscaria (strain Koide BX008) TaxID=946122 RepID=A0A0C2WIU0_AMAMK|nr:hypothetical protein M378DRAFT_181931 [Amanita muscaria Koide BX008]